MTQKQKLLRHLETSTITSFDAYVKFGITQLAARIHELKHQGYKIYSRTKGEGQKSYQEYYLVK